MLLENLSAIWLNEINFVLNLFLKWLVAVEILDLSTELLSVCTDLRLETLTVLLSYWIHDSVTLLILNPTKLFYMEILMFALNVLLEKKPLSLSFSVDTVRS